MLNFFHLTIMRKTVHYCEKLKLFNKGGKQRAEHRRTIRLLMRMHIFVIGKDQRLSIKNGMRMMNYEDDDYDDDDEGGIN